MKRVFTGWDRPFSLEVADRLRKSAVASPDLDETLVWIPSSRAGRHITAELFDPGEREEEAFHPPRLVTPARFVASLTEGREEVATAGQRLMAWRNVVAALPVENLEPVFPVLPEDRQGRWAFGIARQMIALQDRLAEENRDFAAIAGCDLPLDSGRWQALAAMETAYIDELTRHGLVDDNRLLAGSGAELLMADFHTRVIVAGVLNLSPRQTRWLEILRDSGRQVELWIPAPEKLADSFDEWARPRPDFWDRETIPSDLLEGRLHRAGEPRELVRVLLETAAAYRDNTDAIVVGAPDPDLGRYLVERSRLAGVPFYAPEGRSILETGWGRLLRLLANWFQEGRLEILKELVRHEAIANWVRKAGWHPGDLEEILVRLHEERLLLHRSQVEDSTFSADKGIGILRTFLEHLGALAERNGNSPAFPDWLWNLLQALAQAGRITEEEKAVFVQLEEMLGELKEGFEPHETTDADYWEIFVYMMENARHYPEREAEQRPVSGWLELPWETAPHLALLGLPESRVPGVMESDYILSPGLCRDIGLRGAEEEAAFHAFRLRLILESRKGWGGLDILLPDRDLDDYPCQPSRFLFLAPEEEILNRVRLLLEERPPHEDPVSSSFGTTLSLPEPPPLERISVTDFKAYLGSPLKYLIERRLRWEAPKPLPREMDARGFGSLAHDVLQALNLDDTGRGLLEETDIAGFLEAVLESRSAQIYGSRWPVPVRIQVDSLRERLRAAAGAIAAERAAGWRPLKAEWEWNKDHPLQLEGVALHGRIDLLERNEQNGAYRIIDYKTSDKPVKPRAAHLCSVTSASAEPVVEEAVFTTGNKTVRWKDLQLPLYQLAARAALGGEVSCCYFHLAKAVPDIGMSEPWLVSAEELGAAENCARAVIRHIREGRFPAPEKVQATDDWADWFNHDYTATLDPEWMRDHGGNVS